jgi:hypothetical protein
MFFSFWMGRPPMRRWCVTGCAWGPKLHVPREYSTFLSWPLFFISLFLAQNKIKIFLKKFQQVNSRKKGTWKRGRWFWIDLFFPSVKKGTLVLNWLIFPFWKQSHHHDMPNTGRLLHHCWGKLVSLLMNLYIEKAEKKSTKNDNNIAGII